jgi:ribosomal protein S27E
MGTVAECDDARLDALRRWIADHRAEVERIAGVVARAAGQDARQLAAAAEHLPGRIADVLQNAEFVEQTVAHRLAEAGVLPMYGMPTNVRSLYFALATPTNDAGADEARSIERAFDQAVSEFVPGAERTWDKRLLKPRGITGRVRKLPGRGWVADGSPVAAAFLHLLCPDCRQLQEAVADPSTLSSVGDVSWWTPEVASDPTRTVTCPACGEASARAYVAIAPHAFLTDLSTSHAISSKDRSGRSIQSSYVSSPALADHSAYRRDGGCEIALSRQGRVFRTNRNGGDFFALRPVTSTRSPEGVWLSGSIWEAVDGDAQGSRRVAIVSPKTTDVLAIRAYDTEGVGFYDASADLVSRRAAWYSAATILQRAVALELDIDSLDIEIASVHRVRGDGLTSGAELYLADAHPNGAGLVAWAADHWSDLLLGCLAADGPTARLGRLIRSETARRQRDSWRSPDLLLKGFRNRPLHGLIEHGLGLELLAALHDESYRPGIDGGVPDGLASTLPAWDERGRGLVARYVAAFGRIAGALPSEGFVSGWEERDAEGTVAAVVHPLWAETPGPRNGVQEAMDWARKHRARRVRLVDSFNLERRMSWVRAQRERFPVIEVPAVTRPTGHNGLGNGDREPGDLQAIAVGDEFAFQQRAYVRVADAPLDDVAPGDWLALGPDTRPSRFMVRRVANLGAPFIRLHGGASLGIEQARSFTVVARAVEAGTPR